MRSEETLRVFVSSPIVVPKAIISAVHCLPPFLPSFRSIVTRRTPARFIPSSIAALMVHVSCSERRRVVRRESHAPNPHVHTAN